MSTVNATFDGDGTLQLSVPLTHLNALTVALHLLGVRGTEHQLNAYSMLEKIKEAGQAQNMRAELAEETTLGHEILSGNPFIATNSPIARVPNAMPPESISEPTNCGVCKVDFETYYKGRTAIHVDVSQKRTIVTLCSICSRKLYEENPRGVRLSDGTSIMRDDGS